jgi:hypothetical protein
LYHSCMISPTKTCFISCALEVLKTYEKSET